MTVVPAQFEEAVAILVIPELAHMTAGRGISAGTEKEADLVLREAAGVEE